MTEPRPPGRKARIANRQRAIAVCAAAVALGILAYVLVRASLDGGGL